MSVTYNCYLCNQTVTFVKAVGIRRVSSERSVAIASEATVPNASVSARRSQVSARHQASAISLSLLLVHGGGATAMAYLAFASWPLGEIERAVSLVERMRAPIGGPTQPDILAFGAMHAALFALMSGDHLRAQTNTSDLLLRRDRANPAPNKRSGGPSPSRISRGRAASACERRWRWRSSFNRPIALSTRTPFSPRRSKALHRPRKCRRSPRRRHCWWRSAAAMGQKVSGAANFGIRAVARTAALRRGR